MNTKIYHWQGIDTNGMRVQGSVDAANHAAVTQQLETRNIVVIKIQQQKSKKVTAKHITDFSRQLATMINAKIPLLSALNIIEHSYEHVGVRALIMAIKQDIEAGLTLSAAFKKRPHYFDELFSNLVYAGEQSGTLEQMLAHVADYKDKVAVLKRKIKKAMLYPIAVLSMAVIVTAVLLIFVVPQFAELFQGFGAALPIYTQFIIQLSNFIKNNSLYILTMLGIIVAVVKLLHKYSARFVFGLDGFILKIPMFGTVLKKAVIARLARTLAITFAAGLPLSEALKIIAGTAGNLVYQRAILAVRDNVIAGQTVSSSMEQSKLFPSRVTQMIHIGEESGALSAMLEKIAEFYEAEVNHVVDNLSNLLEPMIMAILGILIGGLIIGMYLPIFKLGTVI